MSEKKEETTLQDGNSAPFSKNTVIKRRTLLKALAGIPVLGAFTYELTKKSTYDLKKKKRIVDELGIGDIQTPNVLKSTNKGELLRVGIVGFGNRAGAHANGLGYMHPSDVIKRKENNTLEDWLAQEDLNVALTGICDVFDLHAQRGLETAQSETRAGGAKPSGLPVKRYRTFQEMIDDKDIDAVEREIQDIGREGCRIEADFQAGGLAGLEQFGGEVDFILQDQPVAFLGISQDLRDE